jgi:hypothetical protein
VATARDGIALATDTRVTVAVPGGAVSQVPSTSTTGLEF